MIEVHVDNPLEFAKLYIEYWQTLHVPRELHLKGKKLEFLALTITMNASGVDITNSSFVDGMRKQMRWKHSVQVYNYRNSLKKDGFILEDNTLPAALNLQMIPPKARFEFAVFVDRPMVTQKPKSQNIVKQKPVNRDMDKPPQPPVRPQPVVSEPENDEPVVELPEKKEKTKGSMDEIIRKAYEIGASMRRKGGYSDDNYLELQRQHDTRKSHVEEVAEEEDEFNIIDLNDV